MGGTGFVATTSYSYYKQGVYTPILVAEDSGGCKVFHVGDSAVEIFEPPVAAFTVDDTTLCDSASVQFTDLSSSKALFSIGGGILERATAACFAIHHMLIIS